MAHGIQQADVCIICALEEEAHAVEQVIAERCKVTFVANVVGESHFAYRSTTITNIKGERIVLALLCQTHPGPVFAAFNLGALLEKFQPCFVGMSGICAGDKRHMQLGDLVVAEHAYHFEEGKVTRDEQGMVVYLPEGITYGPSPQVLQYVRTFGGWNTPVVALKKQLLGSDELPQRVMTLMASGMAVHSDDPFEGLQQQHRKTWALDMEAASLYLALRANPLVNGLVVKGVVDYADLSKDDTFHDFAARASAIYLLTFIQEYVTTNALLRKRSPATRRMALTKITKRVNRPLIANWLLRLVAPLLAGVLTLLLVPAILTPRPPDPAVASRSTVRPTVTLTATPTALPTVTPTAIPTPPPTVAPTVDPNSPAGILVQATAGPPTFSDSLAQSNNNWDNSQNCTFTQGSYQVTTSDSSSFLFEPCHERTTPFSRNLAYEVQMTIIQGDKGGIFFRDDVSHHFDVLSVDANGNYVVQGNGRKSGNISGTVFKKGFNQTNLLTVVVRNNLVYFYVNDQFVTSFSDQGADGSYIGVLAHDVSNPTTVQYKNVRVWAPS